MMRSLILALVSILAVSYADESSISCGVDEQQTHPNLCDFIDRSKTNPMNFASELHHWASRMGLLVDLPEDTSMFNQEKKTSDSSKIHRSLLKGDMGSSTQQVQPPVVTAHGMGDSCFNSGMKDVTEHISTLLGGTYAVCVPTGDTWLQDTINGFLLNMDASVDVFAANIWADPSLQDGFDAIGFSQGNNVIRGYIAKYNDPPVRTFISVSGANAGVGSFPHCEPSMLNTKLGYLQEHDPRMAKVHASMCGLINEVCSELAYTDLAQQHIFQANYWRDPRPEMLEKYYEYSQLAAWNNEIPGQVNQTLNENFAKTDSFVWIMATEDHMVWPREGCHWGAPDPQDPYNHILPMEDTEWYLEDFFGLKTAQAAGKNNFEEYVGDHLRFTLDDLDIWVNKYLLNE